MLTIIFIMGVYLSMFIFPAFLHKKDDRSFEDVFIHYWNFMFAELGEDDLFFYGGQGTDSWTDVAFTRITLYLATFMLPFFGMNIVLAIYVQLWEDVHSKDKLLDLIELNEQILNIERFMFWRHKSSH